MKKSTSKRSVFESYLLVHQKSAKTIWSANLHLQSMRPRALSMVSGYQPKQEVRESRTSGSSVHSQKPESLILVLTKRKAKWVSSYSYESWALGAKKCRRSRIHGWLIFSAHAFISDFPSCARFALIQVMIELAYHPRVIRYGILKTR